MGRATGAGVPQATAGRREIARLESRGASPWEVHSQVGPRGHRSPSNGALPLDNVRQIWRFPGPQGQPWRLLSVHGGLFRIEDDLRFTRIATPWDDSGDVAEFALARQYGGAWEHWFGNLRSGIHRLRGGRWVKFSADGAPPAWRVTHLAEQTDASGHATTKELQ